MKRSNPLAKRPRKKRKKTPITPLKSNEDFNTSYRWRDDVRGNFHVLELDVLSNVTYCGLLRLKLIVDEKWRSSYKFIKEEEEEHPEFFDMGRELQSAANFFDIVSTLVKHGVGEVLIEDEWFQNYMDVHGLEVKVPEENDEE